MALTAIAFTTTHADVTTSEGEKPGFMGRVLGFGKKKEEPAPTPPPAPAPAPAAEKPKTPPSSSGSSSKRSSITIKPGSGGGTVVKKSGTNSGTAKKSTSPSTTKKPAPKSEVAKKEEPKKEESSESKPKAEPDKKEVATTDSGGEGEFGHDKDDDKPAATPEPKKEDSPRPEIATKLPANAGWQIVKIGGRDYITGDSLHQFYRFNSYKVEGKHVWLRSNNLILKATIGSQELLINNIKFILSYPVQESSGKALFSRIDLCKLIDPVLRPTYITDAEPFDTIVLDAGHGGHDAGARGVYGYEKDFALKMATVLKGELQRRGFKVVMTRTTDTFITLGGRVAVANATPNSIFLSLHFNSGGSAASGIETFALTPQGSSASLERGGGYNANGLTGNSHDSANIALATAVHAMVISKFKFVDRGIKRAQWSVLTGCKRPGILFEGGFVTNGNECRLIASDTYRQAVSSSIADAVVNYRTALRGAMTRNR